MDRSTVAQELQPLLVELIDLGLTAKQAHWNLTGPMFRSLHLQLDELADEARLRSDRVAERLAALGVPADGRVEALTATPLPAFPAGFVEDSKVVAAVVERLDEIIGRTRQRIERLEQADLVSQGLLLDLAGALEKDRWMFAAQQA
jgi:starvation-inducible DNA-binding protein